MKITLYILTVLLAFVSASCKQEQANVKKAKAVYVDPASVTKGTMTDPRDGKKYKTVTIGEQTWMAENMAFKVENSFCYQNKENNCLKYGRYYDWKSAMKACPAGWHLPSRDDFNRLIVAVVSEPIKSESPLLSKSKQRILNQMLKSKKGWAKRGNGVDAYGFSAIPAGGGIDARGTVRYQGESAYFWTSTDAEHEPESHLEFSLYCTEDGVYVEEGIGMFSCADYFFQSVRCIKDK